MFLAAALALTGCSGGADSAGAAQDSKGGGYAAVDEQGGAAKEAGGAGASRADGTGRAQGANGADGKAAGEDSPKLPAGHIIRTAELTVRVKDVPTALEAARTATENAGGFVGDETTTRDGRDRERTRVVLRVPTAKYEEVMDALAGTGTLVERNSRAEDVTEEVVDVESRVTTQRASVARIRELMDKATKLSDVVTLEGELSRRQADLESLLARQASLKDRTSLATITLSLSETAKKKAEQKDDDPGFVDALAGGWNAFVAVFRWLTLALAAVLPFAVLAAVALLVWLRLVRPRLSRPAPAAPAPATPNLPAARPVPAEDSGE